VRHPELVADAKSSRRLSVVAVDPVSQGIPPCFIESRLLLWDLLWDRRVRLVTFCPEASQGVP